MRFLKNAKELESKRQNAFDELEELKEYRGKTSFEKGDFLALVVAALTTIFPVVLVLLLLYYLISMWFFG